MVHDYRKLNSMTKQDAYPLPRIEDILDQLGNSKYFTTMDLESGYHQVLISKEDRSKKGFRTPYGHFEYIRMPFGMYLDDIIIYGKTLEEHNQLLEDVLERLARHNLKVKLSKCHFLIKIIFLGAYSNIKWSIARCRKDRSSIKFRTA